jgi:hypothetical protein
VKKRAVPRITPALCGMPLPHRNPPDKTSTHYKSTLFPVFQGCFVDCTLPRLQIVTGGAVIACQHSVLASKNSQRKKVDHISPVSETHLQPLPGSSKLSLRQK